MKMNYVDVKKMTDDYCLFCNADINKRKDNYVELKYKLTGTTHTTIACSFTCLKTYHVLNLTKDKISEKYQDKETFHFYGIEEEE